VLDLADLTECANLTVMKQLGSEEARRAFRDLLDEAVRGESTEISRNGKPVAVLMPAADLEVIRDALADAIALIQDGQGELRREGAYEGLLAKIGSLETRKSER
jgi:prevent-host-death family protein